jgi:hypothetical protein
MYNGIKFNEIRVDDDLICDGHHRYLASLIAAYELGIISTQRTSATRTVAWNSVTFDEADWDTQAKINILNQQDAEYSGVSLETIEKFLV